ncbi:unnamed protein product [Polarella glacialis]|uniref:Endo-beta-1,2-glucanase SGL domain-containing protein n=1 Tax=Polarella glacialis TaxID=89957 RepID=A0A813E2H2_POLGL|nr:unnamed protein product [Polarella glacialis]
MMWRPTATVAVGFCAASVCFGTLARADQANVSAGGVSALQAAGCCRFARAFQQVDWRQPETQRLFIAEAVAAERHFFAAPDVSFDAVTGMTYDGHGIDPQTGELKATGPHPGGVFTFSASSKEGIHLSLLALALQRSDSEIQPLIYTLNEALDVLEKKVSSLEAFDASHPGFGGFLPWFCSRGATNTTPGAAYSCRGLDQEAGPIVPTSGWVSEVPGLDNGQMAWATYAVARVLADRAALATGGDAVRIRNLADRWEQRLARMRSSAVPLFYAGQGRVRAVTVVQNMSQDAAGTPENAATGLAAPSYLDDAYEGELMVLFIDLLADWFGYAEDGIHERPLMWKRKQPNVVARNYTTRDGSTLTVQEGYWFSSHEQWKLMVLPYLDIPLVKQVFTNGEHVRLNDAIDHSVPGIFASSLAPPNVECGTFGGYCNAVGVQEVASQVVRWDQSISPYGAYPSILIDPAAGLAWYNIMLSLPHMQTQTGSIESSDIAGTSVAPILTWDTKATTVLAMLGGTGPLIGSLLKREDGQLLHRFQKVVGEMYAVAFEGKEAHGFGASAELPMPPSTLLPPHSHHPTSDFPSCGCDSTAASAYVLEAVAAASADVHV